MGLLQTTEIEYPESDGRPMGETDIHRRWMIRIFDLLDQRYRGQRVYIGSDLLLYYEEGNPKKFIVPDVFVVKDSDPAMRRTYRLWDEGRAPDVVIEVTSRATRRVDEGRKPEIYAKIGVKELFLYDPTCDYLDPPLRGFRLHEGQMVRMSPDEHGLLASEELDVWLTREGSSLLLIDRKTNQRLLTEAETHRAVREAERAAREAAEARAAAEQTAREAAEAQSTALAEEIQRLRKQIDERKTNGE